MAIYQTEAVVLGSKNWGDADKMMTFFTKERGLVRAAAFGCRRPRSPLAGGMQMFSHLDLQLSEGRRVDTVRQCILRKEYTGQQAGQQPCGNLLLASHVRVLLSCSLTCMEMSHDSLSQC